MTDNVVPMRKPNGACGWYPIEFRVIVLPDKIKEKTTGGVLLPQASADRDQHAVTEGVLVAVSPLAFTYEDWPADARIPEVGDVVLFERYAGRLLDPDKPDGYRIMTDKDILAIKEE